MVSSGMISSGYLIPPEKLQVWYQKGFVAPLAVRFEMERDPWEIAKRLMRRAPEAFFLDSGRFRERTARYSYLGWKPFRMFRLQRSSDPTERLRQLFSVYRGRTWNELPCFTGGAVGYFSYELARAFERFRDSTKDDLHMDWIRLLFVRDLLVFDGKNNSCFLIANLIPQEDGSFARAFRRAARRLEEIGIEATAAQRGNGEVSSRRLRIRSFRADVSKRRFKHMVRRAKEYTASGDIYQANLSQRFSFAFEGEAEALYDALRRINPSPFSSFLKMGPLVVASVSPERLIKLNGNRCETRPIAGTRPRGTTPAQDRLLRRDLLMSPKERAEHIMLVDLERNDLGRVSEPESVRESELMTLEKYSHVVHIVSNITGRLRRECDRFDLIRAVFPGGTITGCPKIRSMDIIEELEPFKRHLYTGSIGYLDFNGNMDLNIVIRSLILWRGRGYLQVGAGIVYDSDPEAEYWETLYKGKALIDALCLNA